MGGQRSATPDRLFFEAILYWALTGVPWRDLPAEGRRWDAVYNRFGRWVWSGGPLRTPHRGPGPRRRPPGPHRLHRRPRPPARGRGAAEEKKIGAARSAATEGLGRSRGGLTTKVVLTAADEDTVLAVKVSPSRRTTPRTCPRSSTPPFARPRRATNSSATRDSTAGPNA